MFKFRWLVLLALSLLLVALPISAQEMENTINLGGNDDLGSFLVGPNGNTLYIFTRDALDTSNCVDQCATNWPPLTVESADALTVAEGVPGDFATIERADGTMQVTYNGWPLYYWKDDMAAGDATGQGRGGVWWIVPPATVYTAGNADLGKFLVGPTGMTLYMFTNDEPGVSNCADQCAAAWPPLTVESEEVVEGLHLLGELGTIERADGTMQVTYNGWPLYYWQDDAARGDATGEGRNDVWFTVAPETVGVMTTEALGDVLVGPNGMTLYTFNNDEAGVSNCADECAEAWPPLTVGAADRVVGSEGIEGELGTIERADGSMQVTYNGMPLYFWQDDAAPGDTTGQGLGDVWFAAVP